MNGAEVVSVKEHLTALMEEQDRRVAEAIADRDKADEGYVKVLDKLATRTAELETHVATLQARVAAVGVIGTITGGVLAAIILKVIGQ